MPSFTTRPGTIEDDVDMHKLRENGLVWNVVGDDVVILDLDGSVYLQVNGTGRVLWEALVSGSSRDELARLLGESFDIDIERARADVDEFIADLGQRGLLTA